MTKITAIATPKGGVGKTTLAINLGHALFLDGYSVLLIDLDPQISSLSLAVDIEAENRLSMVEVMEGKATLGQAIHVLEEGFMVAASTPELTRVGIELLDKKTGRERVLDKALDQARGKIDFILIDNAPSLSLLVANSLVAADNVMVPVQPSFMDYAALEQVTDIVEQVNQNHGKDLKCGAVVNGFDPRPLHMGEIVRKINSDQHSGDFTVFETMLSRSVRVMEAAEKAQSILEYAPGHKIADQFRRLEKEYLQWV